MATGIVFQAVVASLMPNKEEDETEVYVLKSLVLRVMNNALWRSLV